MRVGVVAASMATSSPGLVRVPQQRPWVSLRTVTERSMEEGTGSDAPAPLSFRFLTYNVLAQCYVQHRRMPWCARKDLKWHVRSERLRAELEYYDADVVCLQEADNFDEFFRGAMRRIGFDRYTLVHRTSVRKAKRDASVIFWKSKDFVFVEEEAVEFNDLDKDERLRNYRPRISDPEYFIRDCVGGMVVLRPKKDVGSTTRKGVIIATCHLFWNPVYPDVKILQAWWMLKQVARLKDKYGYPVIIGGDFNSTPTSEVVEMITTGLVPRSHADISHVPDGVLDLLTPVPLRLHSAYGDTVTMTNFTPPFTDVIDYVFLDENVEAVRLLEVPSKMSISDTLDVTGFPAGEWPSDHIALGVEIQLQPTFHDP